MREIDGNNELENVNYCGLGKVFGGFILVLLDFRLGGIDILPDIIGYILIYLGLDTLAEYDVFFALARPFAVISAVASLLDIYQISSLDLSLNDIPMWLIVLSSMAMIIHLLLYYYLIFGIRRVAQRQGAAAIERGGLVIWKLLLIVSILFYPSLILASSSRHGDFLIWLMIPLIIVQICFLVFIKKAENELEWLADTESVNAETVSDSRLKTVRKLFSIYFSVLILIIAVAFTACSILYVRNWFNVPVSVLDQETMSNAIMADVRAQMVKAGFLKEDVKDMPDKEVQRYKGFQSVEVNTEMIEEDGGKCRVTSYYTLLGGRPELSHGGYYRMATTYQWLKQPRSGYGDVIGIETDQNDFALMYKDTLVSYNLFDKQDKKGQLTTYQADDIESTICLKPYKRYRVYHDNMIKNQRGYLAFDLAVSSPSRAMCFNLSHFYIHQNTFLTLNEDPIEQINEGFFKENNFDFNYHTFIYMGKYEPQE